MLETRVLASCVNVNVVRSHFGTYQQILGPHFMIKYSSRFDCTVGYYWLELLNRRLINAPAVTYIVLYSHLHHRAFTHWPPIPVLPLGSCSEVAGAFPASRCCSVG